MPYFPMRAVWRNPSGIWQHFYPGDCEIIQELEDDNVVIQREHEGQKWITTVPRSFLSEPQ